MSFPTGFGERDLTFTPSGFEEPIEGASQKAFQEEEEKDPYTLFEFNASALGVRKVKSLAQEIPVRSSGVKVYRVFGPHKPVVNRSEVYDRQLRNGDPVSLDHAPIRCEVSCGKVINYLAIEKYYLEIMNGFEKELVKRLGEKIRAKFQEPKDYFDHYRLPYLNKAKPEEATTELRRAIYYAGYFRVCCSGMILTNPYMVQLEIREEKNRINRLKLKEGQLSIEDEKICPQYCRDTSTNVVHKGLISLDGMIYPEQESLFTLPGLIDTYGFEIDPNDFSYLEEETLEKPSGEGEEGIDGQSHYATGQDEGVDDYEAAYQGEDD